MAEQFIQNPSVTPGDLQIELSGGYVTAISGHPVGGTGGGGGPSVVYTGVVGEITVDNQQGTIGIADEIKNIINSKASKVELNTTYNTLNEAKQDKLTFGYDDTAISSINGSALAGQNDMSQYALKNDLDVVSGEVDILTDTSAKWDEVSAKFDTSSWNAYSGKFQLSGDYATKSDLDLYYKKTETSSKDEISDAIKDFITDDDVTAKNYLTEASGNLLYPKLPNELDTGVQYAYTKDGWAPIQGAGDVSGISFVNRDNTLTGDGNTIKLGVDLDVVQSKLTDAQIQNITDVTTLKTASSTWDNVSAKLNTSDFNTYTATTAPSTYQPKGNYVSSTDITDMATKTWVGTQGYATESDLQIVSGEIPTKVSDLTDSANYYKTTETSGATELSTEFAKYIQTISTGVGLSGDGKTTQLGIDTTASINLTNASAKSAVSAESATNALSSRYAKQLQDASKTIQISDVTALQNWASSNSSTWNEVSAKLTTAQYSTDSATFVTSSNAVITGTKQYALTTAGWTAVQAGSTFTGVTTDNTLTGKGTDASHKLSVAWSALSSNKINSAKSANSAEYITNGTGYSGFNDISAKFGTLSSYVPYSATVLPIGTSNTATNNSIAIGTSNTANDLGFAVGQANTALKRSIAFGVNNYANDISLAIGYENSASGNNDNNQSAVNIAIGYANSAADHAAAFINVCTAQNYAFAAGHANSAVDNSVAFGRNTSAYFYSFDFGHSNYVKNYSYAFGRGLSYEGQWASGSQYGAFVIGGWNATTSYATTADAPLFIVGNGSNNNPSDGFIVYRDGDVTAAGKISANGMFAVSTEATLFGQSRIANVGDTTALGTNWLGVTQSHQGFLKYVNGGNVGDLNGTSIQINFAPDGANSYGNITVNSQNNESKIINVPTASYNNMTTFDPTNGPNYMLRKTASGFDIGAKVVNVTSMPQNLDANTYYFVYEV